MSNDIFDLYIATYDYDTQSIVYVVDADFNEETKCYPGDWETTDRAAIKRFYEWDGESELYNIFYHKGTGFICTAAYPIQDENGEIKRRDSRQ